MKTAQNIALFEPNGPDLNQIKTDVLFYSCKKKNNNNKILLKVSVSHCN